MTESLRSNAEAAEQRGLEKELQRVLDSLTIKQMTTYLQAASEAPSKADCLTVQILVMLVSLCDESRPNMQATDHVTSTSFEDFSKQISNVGKLTRQLLKLKYLFS